MKSTIRHLNDWLLSIAFFIALAFIINSLKGSSSVYTITNPHPIQFITPAPANVLNAVATLDAIAVFRGDEPEGVTFSIIFVSILSSLLLYLMVGPLLLYVGYKKSVHSEATFRPWFWYVGSVVCIAGLSLLVLEIQQLLPDGVVRNNMQSVKESRALDQMRDELTDVSFAVAEYEIVQDGLHPDLRLDELELGGLRFEYIIEKVEGDTLVGIRVEHPEMDVSPQYMEVRPYSSNILRLRSVY